MKSPPKLIKFDFEKNDATDSDKVVDWGKSLLRKNSLKSAVFNFEKDPRVLTVEQIPYCINLLRYCNREFNKIDKLR
jgi:hypothetical protein